ncbi:2Fe-2S iron-sulfur cluster-binding protein [Mesorhizobium calcicola]|uniref:2Fe-2S iron-sulfur cluster-binding protein n=1 Tax=Mesorhizobium calcicola TaxID=1300310 RepID=A0ABW4WM07_9HYPH
MTSSQSHRLASGGLVDRSAPLSFRFDGKTFSGFQGDTLASALIANGDSSCVAPLVQNTIAAPRGILTAGRKEPNALVELRTGARREPNTRRPRQSSMRGLRPPAQNRWPSLRHDVMSVNSCSRRSSSRLLLQDSCGRPSSGKRSTAGDPPALLAVSRPGRGRCDSRPLRQGVAHCDVLIAGSGPTGWPRPWLPAAVGARVNPGRGGFSPGGACSRMAARSTACGSRMAFADAWPNWRQCRRPHHDPHDVFAGSMTAAPMARSSGSATTCPRRSSIRCRPAAVAGRGQALACVRGRRHRTAPIVFAGNDTRA